VATAHNTTTIVATALNKVVVVVVAVAVPTTVLALVLKLANTVGHMAHALTPATHATLQPMVIKIQLPSRTCSMVALMAVIG
jgi:hypothetical protein